MKIKTTTLAASESLEIRNYVKPREWFNLRLYYNTPEEKTLDIIKQYINDIPELRDSELTLYCIKIESCQFMRPQKGNGFEFRVDDWFVDDWFENFKNSRVVQLTNWLMDKLLIYKGLKAISEETIPESSEIGRIGRKGVNTLFEMFNNYFYKSGRNINKKNKEEFIEIVNKIYKF